MLTNNNGAAIETANPKELKHNKDTKSPRINPSFDTENFGKPSIDEEQIKKHIEELTEDLHTFPFHVFPQSVREIVRQTNQYLNYHSDFISAALLYAVSLAIGNTFRIKFKGTWEENGVVYMVLVGRPGTNKSHPITFAIAPIMEKDDEYFEQHVSDDKEFDEKMAAFSKGDLSEKPSRKPLKKFIVIDCTPEAVASVHYNNPRGIGIYVDELAGFIKNFNRYNNSGEQEFYLSNWSGKPIIIDRKTGKSVRVSKPFISIIGTIQNAILDELAKDNRSQNGFIDRILFVKPNNLKRHEWVTEDIDSKVKSQWKNILNKLIELQFDHDDENKEIPNYIRYTKEAETIIIEWQKNALAEDEAFNNETIDSISAKIETYIHRFALILQMLKWACGEGGKTAIDAETAKGAIKIAGYFKKQAIEVAEYINNKSPVDRLPEIKKVIYKNISTEFKTADGLKISERFDMPQRTFEYWLNDKTFFKKVRQGVYQKLFND